LCLALNGSRAVKLTAILALLTAVILLFLKDIHGPAMLLGILIALILIRLDGDRFQRRP